MSQEPRLIDCEKTSYFRFINEYWYASEAQEKISKNGKRLGIKSNCIPFHRLCSMMRKMDAKRTIVEQFENINDINEDNEIVNEIKDIDEFYGKNTEYKIFRLTFITEKISSIDEILKINDACTISSAIIVNIKGNKLWFSYLLRCVIRRPRIPLKKEIDGKEIIFREPLLNNYIHVCRSFPAQIKINETEIYNFKISGTFFCQQNQRTSSCGQSALKMVLNNIPETEKLYSTSEINKIANNYRRKEGQKPKIGFEGLTTSECKAILKQVGVNHQEFNFFHNPLSDYTLILHRFIESKAPCLLIFTTDSVEESHVVPVIGHTLNSDLWKPQAEGFYRPELGDHFVHSSKWIDHFIMHDDNFGMYLCLPVDSLKRITLPTADPHFRANYVIGVVPKGMKLSGDKAEKASITSLKIFLKKLKNDRKIRSFWLKTLKNYEENESLVLRSSVMDKRTYIEHITHAHDSNNKKYTKNDISTISSQLPAKFWLCEISLPELHTTNKSKLADILYRLDKPIFTNDDLHDRLLMLRVPGYIYFPRIGEEYSLNIKAHIPYLRTTETFEW